jgi:hypothetical protein
MVSGGIERGRNDADKLTWVPGETLAGGEVGDLYFNISIAETP